MAILLCALGAADEDDRCLDIACRERNQQGRGDLVFGVGGAKLSTDRLDCGGGILPEFAIALAVAVGQRLANRRHIDVFEAWDVDVRRHSFVGSDAAPIVSASDEACHGNLERDVDRLEVGEFLGGDPIGLDVVGQDRHGLAVVTSGGDAGVTFAVDDVVPAGKPGERVRAREPDRVEIVALEERLEALAFVHAGWSGGRLLILSDTSQWQAVAGRTRVRRDDSSELRTTRDT